MSSRDEQIKALLSKVEDGTKAVFDSEAYKNYLSTMARFHNYSFRNTLLIHMQNPEASYVAGYAAWQKNFHRQVKRGEKGIQIIGYTPRTVEVEEPRRDAAGHVLTNENGEAIFERVKKKIPAYTPVYVFDISQTEGEPLPELIHDLEGNVEDYDRMIEALRGVAPLPISFEDFPGEARGYCSFAEQKIAIREGMSQAQTLKTAVHEITHADLHDPNAQEDAGKPDRRTAEIEAESAAFVVCAHYGLDTSDYSFPYIAGWSGDKELRQLHASLDRIQKQANDLIDRIDSRLQELRKDVLEHTADIESPAIPEIGSKYEYVGNTYEVVDVAQGKVFLQSVNNDRHHEPSLEQFVRDWQPLSPEEISKSPAAENPDFDHLPDGRLSAVGESQLQTMIDIDLRDYGRVTEYTKDVLDAQGYTYEHEILAPKIQLLSFEQDDIAFYANVSVAGKENRCMMREQGDALYISIGDFRNRLRYRLRYDLTDEESAKYRAFEKSGQKIARLDEIEIMPRAEHPIESDASSSRAAKNEQKPGIYTREQIDRAAETDLEAFLESHGERLVKSGREKRMTSDHSVTIRGNEWYDHAAQEGGNAISFVQRFYNQSFPEAMEMLLGSDARPLQPSTRSKEPEAKPFVVPEANADMRRVFAYLVKTRGIDRAIVNFFAKEKLLYEDAKYHNAVFLGRDENGIPRHAHTRSTSSGKRSFRINVEGSDARYSFHHIGSSKELYVFEAPIDLMSYITLHPEQWQQHSYVACCGLSMQPVEKMLELAPEIQTVHLCLDNDDAGQRACDRMETALQQKGLSTTREISKNKDWNEDITTPQKTEPEIARLDGIETTPTDQHPVEDLSIPSRDAEKAEEQRRTNEKLDSVKFDNDIDLDKERSREQRGFRDNAPAPVKQSLSDQMAFAVAECQRRNAARQKEPQQERTCPTRYEMN